MADSVVEQVVRQLEDNVGDVLSHLGFSSNRNVKLLKRTRDLKCGDIIIPSGCIELDELKAAVLVDHLEIMTSARNTFIMKVTRNKFSLVAFHLDRAQFCKAVIKEIHGDGDRYGHAKSKMDNSVFVNSVNRRDTNNVMSLIDLRIGVLSCHVENLLETNGYSVISQSRHCNNLHMLINSAKSADTEQNSRQPLTSRVEQLFIEKAQQVTNTHFSDQQHKHVKCGYSGETVDSDPAACDDGHNNKDSVVDNIVMDLREIIQGRNLCFGSGGFDKNLDKVAVIQNGKPTDVMQEVINLAELLHSKQCCHCLHLVPHQQVFRQQQIQLVLTALSDERVCQSLLVVGEVTPKQGLTTTATEYQHTAQELYKSRYLQMKDASEIRNSDLSSDKQIQLLTSASIKLDLLGNTSHTSLHVDTSSADCGAESRLGAFVLYNAARLATLMSHFTQGVQQGLYPPLPPVEDVDYSLLREEEDWKLVFLYLAAFPDVVRQSVEVVFPTDGKNLAKIHTHKVTSFIVGFTKCLSAHYSRYHVLTGGQAHLLPLMYARLHVLKAAHQVLINSLQLVGVEALSFL